MPPECFAAAQVKSCVMCCGGGSQGPDLTSGNDNLNCPGHPPLPEGPPKKKGGRETRTKKSTQAKKEPTDFPSFFLVAPSLPVVLPKEPHKKNPIKRTRFFRVFPKRTRFFWAQKNRPKEPGSFGFRLITCPYEPPHLHSGGFLSEFLRLVGLRFFVCRQWQWLCAAPAWRGKRIRVFKTTGAKRTRFFWGQKNPVLLGRTQKNWVLLEKNRKNQVLFTGFFLWGYFGKTTRRVASAVDMPPHVGTRSWLWGFPL